MSEVYRWKAIYEDGSEHYERYDNKKVKRFILEPIDKKFIEISLTIDGDKELIFYRRYFFNLYQQPENVIYFLGYKTPHQSFLLSINTLTREIKIEDDNLR